MNLPVLTTISLFAGLAASCAQTIQDPVRDYLQMNVPDRLDYLEAYTIIYRATVDIDGDKRKEVFVGTDYPLSGNRSRYWVCYTPVSSGYVRITPATKDIPINLEAAYVGFVKRSAKQGILEVADSIYHQQHDVVAFSTVHLYSIRDGQLFGKKLPALNLLNAQDAAFYEKYFGDKRRSREVKIEAFTAEELKRKGYTIPTWRPPVEAGQTRGAQ